MPNLNGRVVWPDAASAAAQGCALYVAGWQKRGPSGIIGTNKFDAEETIAQLLSDITSGATRLPTGERAGFAAVEAALSARGVQRTTYDDWRKIDEEERRRGKAAGKPREKITTIEEMLRIVGKI